MPVLIDEEKKNFFILFLFLILTTFYYDLNKISLVKTFKIKNISYNRKYRLDVINLIEKLKGQNIFF